MDVKTHDHITGLTSTTRYPDPAREMPRPQDNLERVSTKLTAIIMEWCRGRLKSGQPVFVAEALLAHVRCFASCAPDSPSRVLRSLKTIGWLDYRLLSRKNSLYEVLSVIQ